MDPLYTLDEDARPVPYLGEAVPDEDYTQWTITVREGVYFHDEAPLDSTALDVMWRYYTASFITSLALSNIAGYEVSGPRSITITMKRPWASFPYILTSQVGYVPSPNMLLNPDVKRPVGTGPFRFGEWTEARIVLDRNPDYWQDDRPYLDEVRFDFLPDASDRLIAFGAGDVDAIHGSEPSVVVAMREAAAEGRAKVVENANGETDVLTINTERRPFDDVDVRRALAHATDTDAWRNQINQGVPKEATNPFAPGRPGFTEDDGYPAHDPGRAKELVDAYESRTGEQIRFTYLVTGGPNDLTEAQTLIDQWAEVGIDAQIEKIEQSDLIARVVIGDYQVADWRNFGSPEADGDWHWWHSESISPKPKISPNVARLADPQIDAALDAARASTDPQVDDEQYQVVAKRLGDQVPYLFLGRTVWVLAARPDVNGLYAAANGTGSTLGAKTWIKDIWMDPSA
jgi:peptide/nickel transport system substrate-binding protein